MRKLQQPVVLNDNPFLAPGNGSSLRLTNVDAYDATVSHMTVTSSDGNNTSTSTQVANQAQVNAFNKIAGQRRVIRNVTLKAEHYGINALFALSEIDSIKATGDVSEYQQK